MSGVRRGGGAALAGLLALLGGASLGWGQPAGAGLYDPLTQAGAGAEGTPRFAPEEPSPGASGVYPVLAAPTPEAVRAWLYASEGVLAPDVRVREVALDLDRDSERLVEVPRGAAGEGEQWLMLLDKRGEGWEVVRRWSAPGVRASGEVLSHGRGQRAALWVRLQGGRRAEVEVVQLQEAGRVVVLGALGASPPDALLEDGGRVGLRLPEGERWWRLEANEQGFEFKGSAAP